MEHRLTKGEKTRLAILRTASVSFRDRGYDVATLEEIGAQLGLTRSAVLHHFGGKSDILQEIVSPYLHSLEALLDRAEREGPAGTRERRRFLTDLVDLMSDHRFAVSLLSRDITSRAKLENHHLADVTARCVRILAPRRDEAAKIRALAAFGAITRPFTADQHDIELRDPESRRVLVDCAVAVLRH